MNLSCILTKIVYNGGENMTNILILLQVVVLMLLSAVLGVMWERTNNLSRQQEKTLEIDDKEIEKIKEFNEQYNKKINDILSYE